jgi:hypothetical protein
VRKHSWLFLRKERDGTRRYYLRARVPADLVEVIGRREIKRSLRTGDRRVAARRINQEAAEVERLFEAARRGLRQETVTSLTEAEIRQIALSWFHSHERGEARRRWSGQSGQIDADDALLEHAQDEAVLLDPEDPSALAGVQDIADRLLGRAGAAGPGCGAILASAITTTCSRGSPQTVPSPKRRGRLRTSRWTS